MLPKGVFCLTKGQRFIVDAEYIEGRALSYRRNPVVSVAAVSMLWRSVRPSFEAELRRRVVVQRNVAVRICRYSAPVVAVKNRALIAEFESKAAESPDHRLPFFASCFVELLALASEQ